MKLAWNVLTWLALVMATWAVFRILNQAADRVGERQREIDRELAPFGRN